MQVSPVAAHESETLCTLQFGARARLIELGQAKQNVDMSSTVQHQFVKYKEDINKLKDDLSVKDRIIEDLKSKLSAAQTEKVSSSLQVINLIVRIVGFIAKRKRLKERQRAST